jgi:hypothetical protein
MVDPLDEPITIRDGVDEGLIPWSKEATEKRLQRARAEDRPVPQPAASVAARPTCSSAVT